MKPIKGYEGLYSITEDGEVYSHKAKRFLSRIRRADERFVVQLYKGDTARKISVLKMVAEAFIPRPDNAQDAATAKDGNPLNTHYSNVAWLLKASTKPKKNYRMLPTEQQQRKAHRHLTEMEKSDVVRLLDKGYTPGVLSNSLGVYLDDIMAICHSSKYIKESHYD